MEMEMQPLEAGARGMDDKRGPTQFYKSIGSYIFRSCIFILEYVYVYMIIIFHILSYY